jgi:hypothetical protein
MTREADFTGHRVRPPHVMRAVLADDKALLSELGRRGAARRQQLRVARKAHQNRPVQFTEDDARYFRELHEECHFDECPID